ncbi:hypothetical protein [Rhodococcus sp. NBC_00297]|uniref:hypothetical protein n=1 Tax=Rhodococcus sp. NBC_00297 TaxID=2976005 RepID=UPI002E2B3C90|nr:hypothetical protein [Rhodococcus sp. NBC_00297]
MELRRSLRRRLWWLPGFLKVALVLVVLSSPYWYDRYLRTIPREPAEVVAAPTCTAPGVTGVVTAGSGAVETGLPRAGTVPDDFAPVDVVACVLAQSMSPGVEALEVGCSDRPATRIIVCDKNFEHLFRS